jgi:hypothetical protein
MIKAFTAEELEDTLELDQWLLDQNVIEQIRSLELLILGLTANIPDQAKQNIKDLQTITKQKQKMKKMKQ